MPEFVIQSGKFKGRKLVLSDPEIVIGRDESCRIRVTSPDVSRFHCLIRQTETGWTARDLGSSNGSNINGTPLTGEHTLSPGDVLQVGPMVLKYASAAGKKRPVKKETGSKTTEDEIASWLTEDTEPQSLGDTTIIKLPNEPGPSTAEPPEEAERQSADSGEVAAATRRSFDSVADEAADIIRRHWESLKQEEN